MIVETLVTEKELCEWMKVSRATVRKLRENDLPYIEVGSLIRYSKEDVQEWLQKHRNLLVEETNAAKEEENEDTEDKNESPGGLRSDAETQYNSSQNGSQPATKGQ